RPRTAYAAAVCVHPSGLFVTSEQALRGRGETDTVTIIRDAGLSSQKVLKARVVRTDADAGLTLLRIEGADKQPAVAFAADEDLAELLELAAFGFSADSNLAEGEYPALSVRLARITSLRRKAGELLRVQLDAPLAPGFSGGVVLDPAGKAAGVAVSSGTPGSAHVIPPRVATPLLAR